MYQLTIYYRDAYESFYRIWRENNNSDVVDVLNREYADTDIITGFTFTFIEP